MQQLEEPGRTIPKTFGTANLIRHLNQNHPVEFAMFDEASKGQRSGAKGKRQGTASTETSQPPLLAYMN